MPSLAPTCAPGSAPAVFTALGGGGRASRQHAFWDCQVARAVFAQLAAGVGRAAAAAITQPSVWLMAPCPCPAVHPPVWALSSLAAVAAMEHGRALLWAHRHSPAWEAAADRPALVASVANVAAARFWLILQDVADACVPPPAGWQLGPDHPFLCVRGGLLEANLPSAAARV